MFRKGFRIHREQTAEKKFTVLLQAAKCISRRRPEACDFPPGPAEMDVGDPGMGRDYMGVVSRYLNGSCGTISFFYMMEKK